MLIINILSEISLFLLIFFILPFINAASLHKLCFYNISSASQSVILSLLFSPALNAFILVLLYYVFPHHPDALYLNTILLINMLPGLYSVFYQNSFFMFFIRDFIKGIKQEFILKLVIATSILTLLSFLVRIHPQGNDILEYFEIGKVFYKEKALFYPILPHYSHNLFSSHALHPPFFTVLQSLCYLIQGSGEYYRVNYLMHGYYVFVLFLVMLTIMKEYFFLGFIFLILAIITSSYSRLVFIMPNGLDAFRLSYFMLSFCLLQYVSKYPSNKKLLLVFAVSLGLSLSTHSSGLLFFILILPIFLASHITYSLKEKYKDFFVVCLVSILIGGWGYFYNMYNFGKFVADDTLLWSKYDYSMYMRYERDLYTLKKMLYKFFNQFKITTKEYGPFYLIFSIMCAFNLKMVCRYSQQALCNIVGYNQKKIPMHILHVFFIFSFFTVVLFSIALNMDLIIKNFRYMMTIYPSLIIAILGFTISFLPTLHKWKSNLKTLSIIVFTILRKQKRNLKTLSIIIALIIASPYAYTKAQKLLNNWGYKPLSYRCYFRLEDGKNLKECSDLFFRGNKEIITYLDKNLKNDEAIFAFDRSQLYTFLPTAKVYFYLDDDIVDFYNKNTKQSLYTTLKNHGIKFIFIRGNYIPFVLYQSLFSQLTVDPEYITLVMNSGDYILLSVNDVVGSNKVFSEAVITETISLKEKKDESFYFKLVPDNEYLVEVNKIDGKVYSLYASRIIEYDRYLVSASTSENSMKFRLTTKASNFNKIFNSQLVLNFKTYDTSASFVVTIKRLINKSNIS